MRVLCSSGRVPASRTRARSALASVVTATFAFKITPDLYGDETDQQGEKDAQWREHSGRDRLEGPCSIIYREAGHTPVNAGGEEISGREDDNGHPRHRKVE